MEWSVANCHMACTAVWRSSYGRWQRLQYLGHLQSHKRWFLQGCFDLLRNAIRVCLNLYFFVASIWHGHVKRDDKYKVVNKSSRLSIRINWLRIFLPPNLQGRFLGTPMETLLLTNTTVLRYLHELCFMSIFFFFVIKFGLTEECKEVWEIFMYTIFSCAMNFTFLNLRYLKTICEWNVYMCRRTSGWWKIWGIWAWMHTASQLHGPASSHVCE